MDFQRDESLGFFKQFAGEDDDGSCAIADFVILHFGNVNENFGSGIIDPDRFEDGRSVVCYLFEYEFKSILIQSDSKQLVISLHT